MPGAYILGLPRSDIGRLDKAGSHANRGIATDHCTDIDLVISHCGDSPTNNLSRLYGRGSGFAHIFGQAEV